MDDYQCRYELLALTLGLKLIPTYTIEVKC